MLETVNLTGHIFVMLVSNVHMGAGNDKVRHKHNGISVINRPSATPM